MSHPTVRTQPFAEPRRVGIAALAVALLVSVLTIAASTAPAGAQINPVTCWTIADAQVDDGNNAENVDDTLVRIDDALGAPSATVVGGIGGLGTTDAEALALRRSAPDGEIAIWAWDSADGLVVIDPTDQSQAAAPIAIAGPKVEGLTWANTEDGDESNDVLYAIDTAGVVTAYTIGGAPVVIGDVADGAGGFDEGADIAWDPESDILYATTTQNSDVTQLVVVDTAPNANPQFTVAGPTEFDLEGLGYAFGNGTSQQVGTTGNDGTDAFYTVADNGGVANQFGLSGPTTVFDFEDIDCEWPSEFVPGVISAVLEPVTCPGNMGTISVTISHDSGNQPVDYSVTINGVTTAGTIAAGDPDVVVSETGLADATYAATASNTTADPDVVLLNDTNVVVNCSAPGVGAATVGVVTCAVADKVIPVTLDHVSGSTPVDFVITVDDGIAAPVVLPTVTLDPGDPDEIVNTDPLAPGTYTITVTADGTQVANSPGQQVTAAANDCVSARGVAQCDSGFPVFFLSNPTAANVTFVVMATDAANNATTETQTVTVTAGQNNVRVDLLDDAQLLPWPEGTVFDLVTTVGADEILDTSVTVDCIADGQGNATISAPECSTVDQVVPVNLAHVTGDTPVDFIITVDDGMAPVVLPTITLNAGDPNLTTTTGPLAPGVYAISVTANGETVASTTDIVIAADQCVSATGVTQCNSGFPVFVLQNPTADPQTITVTGTDLNDPMRTETITVTLNPGDTDVRVDLLTLFSGEGTTFELIATLGAIELLNTTDVVDCSDNPTATISDVDCVSNEQQVLLTFDNSAGVAQTDFLVDITNDDGSMEPTVTVPVAAGSTSGPTPFGPIAPGTSTIEVSTASGLELATRDVTVTDACVEIMATGFCNALAPTEGRIRVTYTNNTAAAIDFTATISGGPTAAAPRVDTIAPGVTNNLTFVEVLADGTYTVTVTAPGADPVTMIVALTCVDPPVDGTPSATVNVACPGGAVTVTYEVVGGNQPFDFVTSINGSAEPTVTVLSDGTDSSTVTLADGTYAIVVTADGTEVYNQAVQVNCTTPGTPAASLGDVTCANGGLVDLTLTVEGGSVPLTFVVSIDGQPMPNMDVPGSSSSVVALGPFPDGSYLIEVTSGGATVLSETIMVDCVGVMAAVTCDAAPAGVLTLTYTNDSAASAVYTSEATGGPTNVPAQSDTVAAGAGATDVVRTESLEDGAYTVTVTIDGVLAYTEVLTVDCVMNGTATAVVGDPTCASGGFIPVDFEVMGGTVPTEFIVTINGVDEAPVMVDPDMTDSASYGPFLDGVFDVEITADGVVIGGSTTTIDCITATAASSCSAGADGEILVNYLNGSADMIEFVTDLAGPTPGTDSQDLLLASTGSVTFSNLADGAYTVTVTSPDLPGETLLSQELLVACDVTVTLEDGCFADNGIIRAVVTNPTAADVVVVLDGVTPGPKTGTIAAGTTGTVIRTGRPDGPYNVVVTVDGATVLTRTVLVQCDAPVEPPTPGDTTFTLNTFCAPDGRIRVTFNNAGDGPSTYSFDVLEIQSHNAVTGTVAPGAQAVITRSGRPEGDYTVVVVIDGVTFTETVTVDCSDPGAEASASAENLCVGGNGWFRFSLNADGSAATDFVVQVEGLPDRAINGVAAGTTVMTSRTGRPDGDYDVAVLADGVVVYTDTFTVACD